MKQGLSAYQNLITRNLASIFSFINLSFIQGANILIQVLMIPIITRSIGLASFGEVMVASSYAALVSLLVNFGSSQSGVKDVAIHKDDPKALSVTFYTIFGVRSLLFLISLLSVAIMYLLRFHYADLFLMANTIILSEVVNPLFFFIGLQNLFVYNLTNLLAKTSSAILILIFIKSADQSLWINFYLGITNAIGYLLLCLYAVRKYKLSFCKISVSSFRKYMVENSYLTGNNILVQLQQSFFLFAVSGMGNPLLLGAYSLCDKIVWSFRILIISFANAVYPKAVSLFQAGGTHWHTFKKKMNYLLVAVFACTSVVLFFYAHWIVFIITGAPNELAASFVKAVSLVPLAAALNALNVIDMLMRGDYRTIFWIGLVIISIAVVVTEIFIFSGNTHAFGFYPIIIESSALPLYLYFIKKNNTTQGQLNQ
ncbi:MAG: oligosaccharide flippase family protein [Bacteroidota bacterium]|nr:oligosaccharide flippase family protein [Bacteroidota bacterium]